MASDPILTNKEKGTLVKAGLGIAGLVIVWPYVLGAVAILAGVLLFGILIVGAVTQWLFKYGLLAVLMFAAAVLVLRWLKKGSRSSTRDGSSDGLPVAELEPAADAETIKRDAELELERIKAELKAEAAARR